MHFTIADFQKKNSTVECEFINELFAPDTVTSQICAYARTLPEQERNVSVEHYIVKIIAETYKELEKYNIIHKLNINFEYPHIINTYTLSIDDNSVKNKIINKMKKREKEQKVSDVFAFVISFCSNVLKLSDVNSELRVSYNAVK